MFQVMANGETFGRSLILSPHLSTPSAPSKPSRSTPNRSQTTPKSSLYRRLSARLSGRRASPASPAAQRLHEDETRPDRDERLLYARDSIRNSISSPRDQSQLEDISINVGKSFIDDLCSDVHDGACGHIEFRKHNSNDKENKFLSQIIHGSARINAKDKREVFKNKSINVFNIVDCITEVGSLHSSLTKSLCDLDSKDEAGFLLPVATRNKELQQSNTTISSGKKRSRNSTESNFQVSVIDGNNLSPDKSEDVNWKSIKRLKIKDSFKFKTKPNIFKKTKKESLSKTSGEITVEPVSPESVKPTDPAGEFVASTSSPIRDYDNTSISSLNMSKQSGFFDISFASIRSSKTVKSASKLRRSVKSFTASFRSERKKKYEKRERNTVEVNPCHLPSELKNVSTPKRDLDDIHFDISPVQVDTVDSTDMRTPVKEPDVDELDDSTVFKTPQSVWLRAHRHSVCGAPPSHPHPPLPAPAPSPRRAELRAEPPSTRDARALSQCHGLSLPVLTPFITLLLNFSLSCFRNFRVHRRAVRTFCDPKCISVSKTLRYHACMLRRMCRCL